MLYPDEFLASLKHDPITGTKRICELAISAMKDHPDWSLPEIEAMEEADILLKELDSAGMLPIPYEVEPASVEETRSKRAGKILSAIKLTLAECDELVVELNKERLTHRIRIGIGATFSYEFSEADLARIQKLLNELRTLTTSTTGFEPDHQQRILARLEALQRELHKRVSDLDKFWGLVGDAGVMLAKLGNDAKPIVDRVREIADIVWNTQGRAEQLPSSAKPPQIGYEPTASDKDAEA